MSRRWESRRLKPSLDISSSTSCSSVRRSVSDLIHRASATSWLWLKSLIDPPGRIDGRRPSRRGSSYSQTTASTSSNPVPHGQRTKQYQVVALATGCLATTRSLPQDRDEPAPPRPARAARRRFWAYKVGGFHRCSRGARHAWAHGRWFRARATTAVATMLHTLLRVVGSAGARRCPCTAPRLAMGGHRRSRACGRGDRRCQPRCAT